MDEICAYCNRTYTWMDLVWKEERRWCERCGIFVCYPCSFPKGNRCGYCGSPVKKVGSGALVLPSIVGGTILFLGILFYAFSGILPVEAIIFLLVGILLIIVDIVCYLRVYPKEKSHARFLKEKGINAAWGDQPYQSTYTAPPQQPPYRRF